ncbi:hypothetical protein ACVIGB_000895 [Bradyrhizobium sp. USDA 4341]
MSYQRVIPRDLFNESSLLKCYGRLYIVLEKVPSHSARFTDEPVSEFEIRQRADDGSIFIENLPLHVGDDEFRLVRPLNSRHPWPLYAERIGDPDFEPVEVFDDEGELTADMRKLLAAYESRPGTGKPAI